MQRMREQQTRSRQHEQRKECEFLFPGWKMFHNAYGAFSANGPACITASLSLGFASIRSLAQRAPYLRLLISGASRMQAPRTRKAWPNMAETFRWNPAAPVAGTWKPSGVSGTWPQC